MAAPTQSSALPATLPAMPAFLKLGLVGVGADALIQGAYLVDALTQVPSSRSAGAAVLFAAVTVLLYRHIAEGSALARAAYLGITALGLVLLASLPTTPELGLLMSALGLAAYVTTAVALIGLLHPLSSKWFRLMQAHRTSSPAHVQLHEAKTQRIRGLVWFLLPLVVVKGEILLRGSADVALLVALPVAIAGMAVFARAQFRVARLLKR